MRAYILMLMIVILCACFDFLTGYWAAYIRHDVKSKVMRIGGVHKLCEISVMIFVSALGVGFDELSKLYPDAKLADLCGLLGTHTAFFYIVAMELISICENLQSIFPNAHIIKKIVDKLHILKGGSEDDEKRD